jgi:small-conductance mechanosensitive channel
MNRTRALPIAWVSAVLIAIAALNEAVRGMFQRTVSFEPLGYLVFGMLLVVSLLGLVLIVRARHRNPEFRGAISELTRLVAIGEALTMAIAWAFYYSAAPF